MDIVTKIRWTCLKEPTLSLFARMNELGDLLDVALQLTFKIADGQNHMKQQIGKLMDFLNGDGNEQQDGLSTIAPEDILQLQVQFKAAQEPQSIFQPECKYSWS